MPKSKRSKESSLFEFTQNSLSFKASIALMTAFVISSIQRFWVHPSGPHTFRQADTIGMCMAFAEDLRNRGLSGLDFLLYPRLLEKGLLDGINATEFPLLNVLGGFFFLGENPWIGVFCTSLLILILNIWVAYSYLPRFLSSGWNVKVSGLLGVMLWFCNASIALQSNIIMPEGLAFPLVLMGMVHLLESGNQVSQLLIGVALCSLGVAVKPTMVIALGSLVASLLFFGQRPDFRKQLLFGVALCLLFPAWWYTSHARQILSFAQGPQIVPLAHLDPLGKLGEAGIFNIGRLLTREMLVGQFPMFFGWFFIISAVVFGEWLLVLCYFLSLIGVIALDGPHTFHHAYYFMGACAFSLPIMAKTLKAIQKHRVFYSFSILLLLWGVLYSVRGNVWTWARDSHYWAVDFWGMGKTARQIIPKNYHLVTDDGGYPQKLLFVGRSGTMTVHHSLEVCDRPEYQSLPLAVITDAQPAAAGSCEGRSKRTELIETSYAKWYVTLIEPFPGKSDTEVRKRKNE